MININYLVSPEKKKNQVRTIVFRINVREIAMILKFFPTSSVSGFNFTLAMACKLSSFYGVSGRCFDSSEPGLLFDGLMAQEVKVNSKRFQ